MCVIGVSVFGKMIEGRNVVIYSDNTGAEAAARKGATRCFGLKCVSSSHMYLIGTTKNFDQHSLVHCLWKRFVELNLGIWVLRVPTDDNIADLPSRLVCSFRIVRFSIRLCRGMDPIYGRRL